MKRKIVILIVLVMSLMATAVAGAQAPNRERDRLNIILDAVSAATGLERAEIVRLMREEDKSLADVISENGGDVAAVQAEIITALTDEFNANIEQNVTDVLNNPLPRPNDNRPNQNRGRDRLDNPLVRGIIGELMTAGLEAETIREQVEAGASLTQIATDAGIDTALITENIKTKTAERLAEDVAEGRLTQEEADERLANLDELLATALNTPLPELQRQARFMDQVNRAVMIAAAQELGSDGADLRGQIGEGGNLAGFITNAGGDVDAVRAAAKTAVEEGVARLVSDDRLSQEEADILLASLDEAIDNALNREFHGPRP